LKHRIQWSKRAIVVVSLCLAWGFVLVACGNQSAKSGLQHKAHGKLKNLKPYSKDKDKNDPSEGDFNVVGQYVTETGDKIVLKIKDKNIAIKKNPSFHKKKKGLKSGFKGKQVVVEVSTKNQYAKSLEPTPKAIVNQEGIYETKDGGKEYKMIAVLVENDKYKLTVKTPKGRKTYQKAEDFKMDSHAQNTKLKGKMVRLEIGKDGKAESLDYSWIDQE